MWLYLHQNQLSGEIPPELSRLSKLEGLYLSDNQLTGCIPAGITGVVNNDLDQLDLPLCGGPLGAPTITAVMPGAGFLTVTWAAPGGTGGPAISAYDLRYIQTSADETVDANWTAEGAAWTTGSGARSYRISGLTDGTRYAVQVRAVTADGDGPWSSSAIGTPATWGAIRSFSPPSAALGGEVVVTVTASGYGPSGGIMETLPAGFSYVSSSLPDDSVTVNGQEVTFNLLGETDFTYTVAAPSAEGSYSFSGVLTNSDRAEVPVGGAITIAVTAGDPLIARYDANGNSMIERGEVIAAINDYIFGEGDEVISRSDVIRLIKLYLFAPSTPHNRPGAPTGLTAVGNGQTRIDLSWSAPPSDGGSAITGYRVEVSEDRRGWSDLVVNTGSTATSYSHTGLTAGSTRHYRVSAINSAGTGPASKIATGTAAGDAPTDRAALAALYNATDGANWQNSGNWLSNAPMGEWHGVTTDSDGRVTQLILDNNQLTGEISAELGSLSSLTVLDLHNNQLTGEIPAELGYLTNVELLDLGYNRLTGEIPAELGGLPNLTGLYLNNNQLTGEIPAELGSLANLTGLYLYSNQLTGEMPAELGSLTYLERLWLGGNQLTGEIPEELGSLTSLQGLYLQRNRLTGEIPAELGSLTYLKDLDLSNNQLTGEIPSALADLSNLEALFLSGNQLTGCIPASLGDVAINYLAELGLSYCSGDQAPDLVASVTSVGDSGILYVGESFTINAEVYNQGTGPAASTTLRYYRSTDRTISTSDTLVGTDPVDPVHVSGTRPESLSRTAPSRTGTYHYGVCVDPVAGESDIRNNCSQAFPATVLERTSPDLVASVTSVGDAGILYVGESFTINAVVYNQGTGPAASTTLRYYRSTDRMISTSDTLVGTDHVDPVPVSGTRPESINRTAPSRTGTYHYGVYVDPVAGESDTRNNCSQAFTAMVLERTSPDLVASVTSVGDAGILYVGESFTINAEVYNQGTGPAASTTLRYYRSTDRTISTSDTLVGTDHVDPVPVSGTRPESISRTAPSRTGTYYYGVCVDPVAGESDTRNNCSDAYPVDVDEPGKPDLIVQSPSASDNNPDTGGPLILYATVQNVGDGRLESARLTYYLSDNDTISGTDSAIRTVDVLDIYASSSIQMVLYGQNAPQDGGTYYYGAYVHSAVPSESNTRNNCSDAYPVVVDEPGNPDLVAFVTAAGDAAVMYVDEPSATISALVGNEGDGTSSSTRLRFYLSSDSSITPTDDTLVGEIIVRAIGAGSSRDYSISMTAPSSEGTYYYYVCVDSVPGESDTQDNCQENAHKVLVLKPVWYYSDAECGRTFSLFPLGFNYWFEGTIHARTALSSVIVRGWVGGYPEGLSYIDDDGGDLGSMTAGEDKDFSVTGFLAFTYQTHCGIHIFLEY